MREVSFSRLFKLYCSKLSVTKPDSFECPRRRMLRFRAVHSLPPLSSSASFHFRLILQVLLQLPGTWYPPSTRLPLSWTGAGRRTTAGAGTSPSPSSASAAAAPPVAAAAVAAVGRTSSASHAAATCASCPGRRASRTPQWPSLTSWPTLTTLLRSRHRTECRRWLRRWGSTPPSPSPPTKLVRCHSWALVGLKHAVR